jgi:DNA-binding transcriptional regulator YbjK
VKPGGDHVSPAPGDSEQASTGSGSSTSKPKRRRRGEARHRAILEATLRVIAREGLDGVTHRAVAQEANVPLAATTYYFDSRDEMLEEALELAAAMDIDWAHSHADRISRESGGDPVQAARLLASLVGETLRDSRDELVWQYTLFVGGTHRPHLRDTLRRWVESYEALGVGVVGSRPNPEDQKLDSRLMNWVLDGIFIDQLAAPKDNVEELEIRPVLERLLTALHKLDESK